MTTALDKSKETTAPLYRVAWRKYTTGLTGHGDWMSHSAAEKAVDIFNKDTLKVHQWLDRKRDDK